MSVLTFDVVGRAMFGADLVTEAPPLKRSLATGQRLALLGAFLPAAQGPVTTRFAQRLARRLAAARIQDQVEQLIGHRLGQALASLAATGDVRALLGPATCWSR